MTTRQRRIAELHAKVDEIYQRVTYALMIDSFCSSSRLPWPDFARLAFRQDVLRHALERLERSHGLTADYRY